MVRLDNTHSYFYSHSSDLLLRRPHLKLSIHGRCDLAAINRHRTRVTIELGLASSLGMFKRNRQLDDETGHPYSDYAPEVTHFALVSNHGRDL